MRNPTAVLEQLNIQPGEVPYGWCDHGHEVPVPHLFKQTNKCRQHALPQLLQPLVEQANACALAQFVLDQRERRASQARYAKTFVEQSAAYMEDEP